MRGNKSLVFILLPMPLQQNTDDCGVFVMLYADMLAQDRPIDFNANDIPAHRHRIRRSLEDVTAAGIGEHHSDGEEYASHFH